LNASELATGRELAFPGDLNLWSMDPMDLFAFPRRPLMGALACLMLLASIVSVAAPGVTAQSATPTANSVFSVTPGPEADELTVKHAQGETVVPLNPEVVISFDIASVDTLSALGIKVDGMPTLNSGDVRYETEEDLEIGTLFEPDYEAVNAAEPDLIIVAARSAAAYPELSKIAPTIDLTFTGTDLVGDLTATANVLAAIFQQEETAQTILDIINGRIETLRGQAAGLGTALVVMTTGGNVTALAPGGAVASRGALIYQTLGFVPPVDDVEAATHGEPISFEFLLEHNPDWLFVIDRDKATGESGQPAEQVLDNELVRQTTAWQNGQIVYLEPFDWYIITGAGLSSMQRMLDEIEAAFAK
jgi:iron complex transport system substrate-binding protein